MRASTTGHIKLKYCYCVKACNYIYVLLDELADWEEVKTKQRWLRI